MLLLFLFVAIVFVCLLLSVNFVVILRVIFSFPVSLMTRFNQTESANFKLCMFSEGFCCDAGLYYAIFL